MKGNWNMPPSPIRNENDTVEFSSGIQRADRRGALIVSLPKWLAWAIIAWQIRLSIEALVGKYAFPSLLTRSWRQASIWEVVCWGAGMLGLAFGLHSRRLFKKQLAQDWARIKSIEERLDALTPDSRSRT
jgi:hypothetical protein